MSAELRHFLSLCLRKDYQERPPVQDLLSHPWIRAHTESRAAGGFVSGSTAYPPASRLRAPPTGDEGSFTASNESKPARSPKIPSSMRFLSRGTQSAKEGTVAAASQPPSSPGSATQTLPFRGSSREAPGHSAPRTASSVDLRRCNSKRALDLDTHSSSPEEHATLGRAPAQARHTPQCCPGDRSQGLPVSVAVGEWGSPAPPVRKVLDGHCSGIDTTQGYEPE